MSDPLVVPDFELAREAKLRSLDVLMNDVGDDLVEDDDMVGRR